MKKSSIPFHKKIKYLLEYLPLQLIMAILSHLPYSLSLKLGARTGRLIGRVMPKRHRIAQNNILSAFPELSIQQSNQIIQKCWENLGRVAAEFSKIKTLSKQDFQSLFETRGLEHIQESYKNKTGVVLLTAHYGPWELAAQFLPFNHLKTAVVARRIKNPHVNEMVNQIRQSHGNQVILARNAVRESIRWLKQGNILVMLMDHRISEGGLKIPLFGRLADTTSLPAILGLRYNIPMHYAHSWRSEDQLHIEFSPRIKIPQSQDMESAITQTALILNHELENWVRQRPEQWLWIHNRWKNSPASPKP